MHSGLLSPLCCRGVPAGTAPDAGSAGESSPGPHQHLCLYCAPSTGAVSITSAAWSTWHLLPAQAPTPQQESQCWCLEASEALPLLFSLDGGGNTSRPRICISTGICGRSPIFQGPLLPGSNSTANFLHFF